MRLKITGANINYVASIEDESSIAALLEKLVDEYVVSRDVIEDLNIKIGFPPTTIDLSDKSVKLLDVGIRPNDKLILDIVGHKISNNAEDSNPITTQLNPSSSTPHVKTDDGYVVLRKTPDDNSCLFRSISYAVFHNFLEGSQLRSIVADEIRDDPDTYSDAILGQPRSKYIDWILKPTSWGGAIELQIISKYLNITIKSVDVENGRVDNFNEGQPSFIILFYTGIHYDVCVFTPLLDIDNKDSDVGVFSSKSSLAIAVLKGVQLLSKNLNHKGYVTNTSTFKIKCNVCGAKLDGEKQATQHASETGHTNFGEVN